MNVARDIRLNEIAFDAGTQIRAALNTSVVDEYAERMTEGVVFPPIVLFHYGTTHYLADGFHRYMASQRVGFTSIPADVRAGTKDDALWFALAANKANGQRLSHTDVKHAIELALRAWPTKSTKEIADQIGCSQPYVASLKGRLQVSTDFPATVVRRDGKATPANRGRYKPSMREDIAALVKAGETSQAICSKLRARPEMVADVRRELGLGGLDRTRKGIEARRDRIREMAAEGYTTRQIIAATGLSRDSVLIVAKRFGIDIAADRVVGTTRHHDATRIISRIVMDAENLTDGTDLIDFADINRADVAGWLESLKKSRDRLSAFIRRLMQEQQNNGEAA